MQETHAHYTPAQQSKDIVLLCDHIVSPANQGALFRLADAFGVKELIFLGAAPDNSSSRLKKTARSTQDHIPFSSTQDGTQAIQAHINQGYYCVALEIAQSSAPIASLELSSNKILLIIGNEQAGVSQQLLDQVQSINHIPMYGRNSSMNVAQATAIALYQLSQ